MTPEQSLTETDSDAAAEAVAEAGGLAVVPTEDGRAARLCGHADERDMLRLALHAAADEMAEARGVSHDKALRDLARTIARDTRGGRP